jgi:hypothetical protein
MHRKLYTNIYNNWSHQNVFINKQNQAKKVQHKKGGDDKNTNIFFEGHLFNIKGGQSSGQQ